MELWIRSQDKKRLISVTQLEIKEKPCIKDKRGYAIVSINFENTYGYNFLELGINQTEERAFEILNEIQLMDFSKNENVKLTTYGYVYEMPKE